MQYINGSTDLHEIDALIENITDKTINESLHSSVN